MDEKIRDRIAKLIAKAEGTDNEEEAATFMAAAMKMMARHQLDEAEIRAGMGKDYAPPEIVTGEWVCSNEDGLAQPRIAAADQVVIACECHALIRTVPGIPKTPWTLMIYGTREAVDTVLVLIRSLAVQWDAAANKAWTEQVQAERKREEEYYGGPVSLSDAPPYRPMPPMPPIPRLSDYYPRSGLTAAQEEAERLIAQFGVPPHTADDIRRNLGIPTEAQRLQREQENMMRSGSRYAQGHGSRGQSAERRTTFIASFIEGYGERVAQRLKGTREQEVAEHPGAGLVLAADSDRAQAQLNADFPNLSTVSNKAVDHAARAAGAQAGAGADLGGQRFGWAAERGPRGIGS